MLFQCKCINLACYYFTARILPVKLLFLTLLFTISSPDLVTPTMGPPTGKSPSKRPRPVQRVMLTDESFREKRSKSHDAPKTPANQG